MKKVSIIFLVLVMLLAFVSCDKDKSGEMVATYEEFMNTYNSCYKVAMLLGKKAVSPISVSNDENFALTINTINNSDIKVTEITEQSGSVTESAGENTNDVDAEYKNISIKYKYTEGSDTTVKEGILTVSGTYKHQYNATSASLSRGTGSNESVSYVLTINGKQYKLSYFKDINKGYTSASVNGKDVELRLLNAEDIH